MIDNDPTKQENKDFKFILRTKEFTISSNYPSVNDVNPHIYAELKEKGIYHIKSNVKENIFQNFLNNWVNNEIPSLTYDNIVEYEQLSQEFDRMNDVIKLFYNQIPKTDVYSLLCQKEKLIKKISKKSDELKENDEKYQKIISILFNDFKNDKYFRSASNKNKIYSSCLIQNDSYIELLSNKIVENNGFLFSLNEKNKTATIIHNLTASGNIFIPRSIIYDSQEFVITEITKFLFFLSQNIQSIQFSEDSELQLIDDNAFSNSSLETIVIPRHVTRIGNFAFSYCRRLKSIEFSKNTEIKTIEKNAISNSSIQYLSIPSNIENFDEGMFNMVYNLVEINVFSNNKKENITLFNNELILGKSDEKSDIYDVLLFAKRNIEILKIPPFVKTISSFAFQCCNKLKTIEFANDSKLEIIGEGSFYASSIESILIPQHVTRILPFAFCQCKNLKTVLFSENSELKSIEKNAFACSSIEKISIPPSVIFIGKKAFFDCKNFKEFALSGKSNLKSFGNNAFSKSIIESIEIPSSIEEFKEDCFYDICNLNNIKITSHEKQNISLYNNDFIIGKSDQKCDVFDVLILARRNIEFASIPSFIKKIASNCFQNCNQLKTIKFSDDSELKTIEKEAFSNSSIETIIVPKNVEFIGDFAFYNSKLQIIEFKKQSKLKAIGQELLSDSLIEDVLIPSDVTQIKIRSFANCKQLKKVTFSEHSKIKTIEKYSFIESSIESLSIPSSVVELKKGWCKGIYSLNNIEIIESEIQNFIEYNNELMIGKSDPGIDIFDVIALSIRNIEKITIPSFIKRIGSFAFQNCTKLKTVIFKDDSELNSIDKHAFDNSSIEKIKIPKNVKQIQKFALSSCRHLKNIDFSENSNLERIENFTFANSSIEKFNLPPNVTFIGEGAFNLCHSLKSFVVPENSKLQIIDHFAFLDCMINSIFIPSYVDTIGDSSFSGCLNLKIIEISENSKMKIINSTVFDETDSMIMIPSCLSNKIIFQS